MLSACSAGIRFRVGDGDVLPHGQPLYPSLEPGFALREFASLLDYLTPWSKARDGESPDEWLNVGPQFLAKGASRHEHLRRNVFSKYRRGNSIAWLVFASYGSEIFTR